MPRPCWPSSVAGSTTTTPSAALSARDEEPGRLLGWRYSKLLAVSREMGSTPRDSDDAIATKTLEGVVTSWNGGPERLFGYTATEMVGRPITTLFPPERLGEEADFLRRLSRGEQVDHYETVHVRKDGRPIDVSVTLSPLRDADGTLFPV